MNNTSIETSIVEIDSTSPAFAALVDAINNPGTYVLRLHVREAGIAVKRNGGMWTATLSTTGES